MLLYSPTSPDVHAVSVYFQHLRKEGWLMVADDMRGERSVASDR